VRKVGRTPQGEDPTAYPLDVMSQLQSDLAMRAYRNRQDKALADKLTAWKDSINKVEMAYEILAYPRLSGSGLIHETAVHEAIRDALRHPNQDIKEHPHRAPIELNDEELKTLGKLTKARDVPFDPNKRVYRYIECLIGKRTAPSFDGEAIGIPAYVFLKPGGD
jgi:hypothetical protein